MQWRGDTLLQSVGGKFIVNGDHTMQAGDRLGLMLLDQPDAQGDYDDKLDPNTDAYGKYVFKDTLDISQGGFFVIADEAIDNTSKGTTWKDVVTAGKLIGQFKQVEDNSPLVDFHADYTDANKVHLALVAQGTPAPTPQPKTAYYNTGTTTLTDPNTPLDGLIVADTGTATLNLNTSGGTSSATYTTTTATIGKEQGSTGVLNVNQNTSLKADEINVGAMGTGTLNATNSQIDSSYLRFGVNGGTGTGVLNNAHITTDKELVLGANGTGSLTTYAK